MENMYNIFMLHFYKESIYLPQMCETIVIKILTSFLFKSFKKSNDLYFLLYILTCKFHKAWHIYYKKK